MNCQMLPSPVCRYSSGRISPCTTGAFPLFFYENIPQHHSASDTTSNNYQPTNFYQL